MWIAAHHRANNLHVTVHLGDSLRTASVELPHGAPFAEKLLALIDPYLVQGDITPVICSGVAGGIYTQVPCPVPVLQKLACSDPRVALYALPCISQDSPVDLMQGEEAIIAGFLAQFPEWDGVLCLPHDYTRWVHISAGEVVSFRSTMTGEMAVLLGQYSSIAAATNGQGWDADAFLNAVSDAMSRPERFTASLFSLHADALLNRTAPATGRARLTGALIGIELAATRPYWLGRDVALIGEGETLLHYTAALSAQGVAPTVHDDVQTMAQRGLKIAFAKLAAR
jgi:2-dehydro-3-deoxygalactonokinase